MVLCAIQCTRKESSQGPQSQILTTRGGGGGSERGLYFITKEITTSEFVCQLKSLLFLAYPKKSLSPFFTTPKNPFVFFTTQKNPSIFHRPKKSLLAKISDSIKSFDDPPPPPPPSLKYVSGAPGEELFRRMLDERTAGLPSVGFLDTDSLGSNVTLDKRYRHRNDKGNITYHYLLREMSL